MYRRLSLIRLLSEGLVSTKKAGLDFLLFWPNWSTLDRGVDYFRVVKVGNENRGELEEASELLNFAFEVLVFVSTAD